MHVLKQTLLMVLFCFIFQMWLPWWTLIIPCAVLSYFSSKSSWGAFIAGFLAVALLWFGMSIYIDMVTASPLSQKIANVVKVNSVLVLQLLMALVGGLTGGFASLTAYSLKNLR